MKLKKLIIILSVVIFAIFVIGLAWSISTGLAGFWRGLPFWFIILFVLFLLIYFFLISKRNNIKTKLKKLKEQFHC